MPVTSVVGPPPSNALTVMPVIDYEPPTRDLPWCLPSSHAAVRPPGPHRRVRSASGDGDRDGEGDRAREGTEITPAPLSAQMRQAAVFADGALRRVLEVIDRRRPATQLRSVLAPGLIDAVLSVCRLAAGPPGAAVLRRTRLQPAVGNDPDRAAEVFGTFSRGERIHAIACRVEQSPDSGRWLVVALHIG